MICDIHTHILPGIDDGASDWEMSLAMVKAAAGAKVGMIIATPHYLPWKSDNHTEQIEPLCRELMYRSKKFLDTDITILPGQEIFYHQDLLEELQNGTVLTLAESRYVLVEFAAGASGQMISDSLGRLRLSGYLPILAHMERYPALRKDGWLKELKQRGILLQMNTEAIRGGLFDRNAHWCRHRITEGMVDLMGSDMHNLTSRPPLKKEDLLWLKKHVDKKLRRQLFGGLPQ